MRATTAGICGAVLFWGCSRGDTASPEREPPAAERQVTAEGARSPQAPTREEAHAYIEQVERELRRLAVAAAQAEWDKSTNITDGTERASARASEALMAFSSEAIRGALRFRATQGLSTEDARKFELLRRGASLPAPDDAKKREELAALATEMESLYGKGKYCVGEGEPRCRDLEQLSDLMESSHDYDALYEAWNGWHQIGGSLRPLYQRYVELANEGARAIGFADLGELWRSGYDMPPTEFSQVTADLYQQVAPLYEALHCYVRRRLARQYGADRVPEQGLIPAHLLGNMWAQEWSALYARLEPYKGQGELDVTKALVRQKYDEVRMVKLAESFFVSLGMSKLPETFWQRSMFKKPGRRALGSGRAEPEREVVCHASAWDVSFDNDLRIKMCVKINHSDLITIHHELGHNYYFAAYHTRSMLLQDGANDGFHEAIGDAVALSITPSYLKQVRLLDSVSVSQKATINQLFQDALEKVAFLPFAKLTDEWRFQVFSGEIPKEKYNEAWWQLRAKYQGVGPVSERAEDYFDPGAKYHIPANVPYTRYFLATLLQYQFHRAMCQIAGHPGPLHTCSVFGNRAAGEKLQQMLALGASKPWPDALEVLTSQRAIDPSALLDYYAPLRSWLDEQNKGHGCGW